MTFRKLVQSLVSAGFFLGILFSFGNVAQAAGGVRAIGATTASTVSRSQKTPQVADHVQVVYTAYLGHSDGYSIYFKLLRDGTADEGIVTAKFICTNHHGHVRVFFKEIGDALGSKYSAAVEDYCRLGHKQVFAMAGLRARNTCLLDCDGTQIRTLYERFNLHGSDMEYTKGGQWVIEETWRKDCTHFEHGTFYDMTDDWQYEPYSLSDVKAHQHPDSDIDTGGELVTRLLKWNGKKIAPVEPGRYRIVQTTVRRYSHRFGFPIPKRYTHPTLPAPPHMPDTEDPSGPSDPSPTIQNGPTTMGSFLPSNSQQ